MVNDFASLDAQDALSFFAKVASHEPSTYNHPMTKTTKRALEAALFEKAPITLGNVRFAVVNSVEKESGSGYTFNVSGITDKGERATVYVETEKGTVVKDVTTAMAVAFEFGFRCRENGMNLQAAQARFDATMNS